jgi:hypothetical protein
MPFLRIFLLAKLAFFRFMQRGFQKPLPICSGGAAQMWKSALKRFSCEALSPKRRAGLCVKSPLSAVPLFEKGAGLRPAP